MAKEAAERYQTAEDFGYDLAQLQDTLKREMTDEFMAQAKTAMEDRSWDTARQKLQEILRLDRRNQPANELYKIVREQIQLQQRSQQIEQLKLSGRDCSSRTAIRRGARMHRAGKATCT